MALQITYCFVSPFSTEETVALIERAFAKVGKIKKTDSLRGHLLGKYRVSAFRSVGMEFFIQRDNESCKVRVVLKEELLPTKAVMRTVDSWWDKFLTALSCAAPGTDFGVSLANGEAYIVGVLYLGDDTHQVHTSRTTSGTSLLGFLAGGALFGSAGAIVGGMSGKQRTVGHSFEQFSNSQLARVIYNNGRLWEGDVKKGSAIHNEIMVNM